MVERAGAYKVAGVVGAGTAGVGVHDQSLVMIQPRYESALQSSGMRVEEFRYKGFRQDGRVMDEPFLGGSDGEASARDWRRIAKIRLRPAPYLLGRKSWLPRVNGARYDEMR